MTDFLFNQDIKKSFEIHDCSKLKDFLMNNYKKDGDYNLFTESVLVTQVQYENVEFLVTFKPKEGRVLFGTHVQNFKDSLALTEKDNLLKELKAYYKKFKNQLSEIDFTLNPIVYTEANRNDLFLAWYSLEISANKFTESKFIQMADLSFEYADFVSKVISHELNKTVD